MTASRLAFAAAVCFGIVPGVAAQEGEPRLPSLTPREFEIRGDVRVDLPQIERQPLSGFGPPPRTYVVPADRAALTGAYDPSLDALPPLALVAPAVPPSDLPTTRYLRAEATYGNEAARTARLDLSVPVASGQFTADVDYEGLGSTSDEGVVSFDHLDAMAGIQSGGPLPIGLFGTATVSRYAVPGLVDPPTNFLNPLRRLSRFGATTTLGTEGVGPIDARVEFTADRLAPATDGAEMLLGDSQSGAKVEGRVRVRPVAGIQLDARGGAAGLDEGIGQDMRFGSAGAAYEFTSRAGASLSLGARVLAYEVGSQNGNGDARAIAPIVELSVPIGNALRAFGSNSPRLVSRSLGDLAEANPFVEDRPVVAPDVLRADARAGVELVAGGLSLRGFALFVDAPTYLFYQRAPDGRYVEVYDSIRMQGIGGEASVVLPSGISFDAVVTARETELTEGGGEIPFVAPFTARGSVQVPFSRGRLSATLYREGDRPANTTDTVDGFTLLSADARFDVTSQISVLLQADRLAGAVEEWPGYPLVGTAVRGGVRVTL